MAFDFKGMLSLLPVYRPYTNIQPFTVRDGATYQLQIETVIDWLTTKVIPHIDKETGELTESWETLTQQLILDWETRQAELNQRVDDAVASIADRVEVAEAAKVAAEAARDLAAQYASQAEEIQDGAITTIVNDQTSSTYTLLSSLFASVARVASLEEVVEEGFTGTTSAITAVQEALSGRLADTSLEGKYAQKAVDTDFTQGIKEKGQRLVQVREAPLTPYRFGALDPLTTNDNTAAIEAMFAAARGTSGTAGGSRIHIPAGLWVHNGAPIPLTSNVIVEGAGARSFLVGRHASNPLFNWTQDLNSVVFRDFRIATAGASAHIFNPTGNGGLHRSAFVNMFMNVEGANAAIYLQETAASFIQNVFRDCELQRTQASTIAPIRIVNGGGGANVNIMENVRLNGYNNPNTPFVHIESTLAGSYAIDWTFLNVLGEQNPAGLIHGFAAFNWTFINVTDEDSTIDYNNHLLAMFAGPVNNLKSRAGTFIASGRRGRQMAAGKDDIYVDGGQVTAIACNPSTGSQSTKITVTNGLYTTQQMTGHPLDLQGNGSPLNNYAAPVGSRYIRKDGGAGTTFYFKESGTDATGWVAK